MFDALFIDAKRITLWAFLTIFGAALGCEALVNMGHTYAQSPCSTDGAGNVYVAYAWPGSTPARYSDATINQTECSDGQEATQP